MVSELRFNSRVWWNLLNAMCQRYFHLSKTSPMEQIHNVPLNTVLIYTGEDLVFLDENTGPWYVYRNFPTSCNPYLSRWLFCLNSLCFDFVMVFITVILQKYLSIIWYFCSYEYFDYLIKLSKLMNPFLLLFFWVKHWTLIWSFHLWCNAQFWVERYSLFSSLSLFVCSLKL